MRNRKAMVVKMSERKLKKRYQNILFAEAGNLFGYSGFTQQFLLEATGVKKENYNVKVVAFEYPKSLIRKKKSKMYKEKLRSSGVKYFILPLLYESESMFGRLADFINVLVLGIITLLANIQIIHSHDRISAYYATLLKRVFDVKVIYDIHGVGIEEAIYANRLEQDSQAYRTLEKREEFVIRNCDFVFCVSEKMRDYVSSKYDADISKFLVTPTNVDTSIFLYSIQKKRMARNKLGLDDKFVVLYMGHINSWQKTDALMTLFKSFLRKCNNAHFLVLTDGKDLFREKSREHGILGEFISTYTVQHKEVPDYAIASDVAVLLRDNSIVNRVASPAKFGEYLALGLPVVVTKGLGDTEEIVRKYNVGVVLENLDQRKMDKTVDELLNLVKSNASRLSDDCTRAANDLLSKNINMEKIRHVYEDLNEG